jgi:transcriptional regulator with XRE-family HTH domain
MTELRSQKQQRAHLVRLLRVAGSSWVEIAQALRQRYRLNTRVAFRYAHGWSQRRAADEWNQRWPDELKTFKNFSYWEQWPSGTGHAPSFDTLSKLAELYECAVTDLLVDLPNFRHLDAAIGNRDVREWLGHPEAAGMSGEPRPILGRADATSGADHDVAALGEDVDRRGFTGMAAGLLASATIPLVQAPARVDAVQVRYLQATVEQLRTQDQSRGGGAILRLSLHQFARARRMVNESDYTETVGRQLLAAASALGIRAGWAAFDHGDQQLARFLYGEAQLLAASSGSIESQTHVLLNMSMQNTYLAHVQGNLGLARAGLRLARLAADVARYEPSPRLHALIALRQAAAHAQLRDAGAFQAAITQARRELDRGPWAPDSPWCTFVIEPESAGMRRMDCYASAAQTGRSSSMRACLTMTGSPHATGPAGKRASLPHCWTPETARRRSPAAASSCRR